MCSGDMGIEKPLSAKDAKSREVKTSKTGFGFLRVPSCPFADKNDF
jgi:hypothetical protein